MNFPDELAGEDGQLGPSLASLGTTLGRPGARVDTTGPTENKIDDGREGVIPRIKELGYCRSVMYICTYMEADVEDSGLGGGLLTIYKASSLIEEGIDA